MKNITAEWLTGAAQWAKEAEGYLAVQASRPSGSAPAPARDYEKERADLLQLLATAIPTELSESIRIAASAVVTPPEPVVMECSNEGSRANT